MDKLELLATEGKINEEASVKDKQSIIIHMSIEDVWIKLTDINSWTKWNSQVKKSDIGEVKKDSEFNWTLNNTQFKSKVTLLDKPGKFSFISKSSLIKVVMLFKLEEVDTHETSVQMEGSMEGLKTIFTHKHRDTHRSFLKWLEDLQQN